MRTRFIHIAFFFFFLTAFSGVWMRWHLLTGSTNWLPFSNILHAHSHIAILGWTFFAVFIIFTVLVNKQKSAFVSRLSILLFLVTLSMFIAFLVQGYALYSIIFSTLHIFLEYAIAYFIVTNIRKNKQIPKSSRLFMYGAVIMLIVSSIGPFALGGIASVGLRESPIFEMAIYFYLHFQYNGWLYLILIGMFLLILRRRHIPYSDKAMSYSFWIYFFALFPSYLLSVLWYGVGIIGYIFAAVGAIGQLIGVAIFIITMLRIMSPLKRATSPIIYIHIIGVSMLLSLKSIMELGLLYPSFGEIIYDTRSVVIAYLHLVLLGFISIFILTQLYLTKTINENHPCVKIGLYIFVIGFAINELTLLFSTLFTWLHLGALPGQNIILAFASICLLFAIICIWISLLFRHPLHKNTI